MLTMAAGGAFAGIMLLTCGASIPIIFAGYGVKKQLMGVTYDVIEYGGIDNLLKATDCKDIFEYGGNQLFYLAINTYSGYKAGQRLEAAWKNRTKTSTSPKTRLPRTNGKWSGEPGNGKWFSNNPVVIKIIGGKGVEFKKGRPFFHHGVKVS